MLPSPIQDETAALDEAAVSVLMTPDDPASLRQPYDTGRGNTKGNTARDVDEAG